LLGLGLFPAPHPRISPIFECGVESEVEVSTMARRGASPVLLLLVAALAGAALRWSSCFLAGAAPRRELLGAAAAASLLAVTAPPAAHADYQGEPARAFKKYGGALLRLESAVDKGDLESLKLKLRKFDLFTGAYRNQPDKLNRVSGMTDKIIDAVQAGDKATVKTEYANLLKYTELKKLLIETKPPKGARIVDTSSSIAGTAKLTDLKET